MQQKELFCKEITDFIILYVSAQTNIGKMEINYDTLEDRWQQITQDYKRLSNKNPSVIHYWKKISSIMSKHFITKKMINADQIAFQTHPKLINK